MNTLVAGRRCTEYDLQNVYKLISEIYKTCSGPDVRNKKVLIKPNILTDTDPVKCVCTHPVVVEAMIKFLQDNGAKVFVGDSPAVHLRGFKPEKSGIYQVCERTGAAWTDFNRNPSKRPLGRGGKIRVTSAVNEADLVISMPKLKNHELVYFTGAIKNTLGFVPGFSKARQHALHHDRLSFASFLVDLSESITPDFFLMDGITGMEGSGPGQGFPVKTEVLLGSVNPVALDIIASTIAGYDPMDIPTTIIALKRGKWLKKPDDVKFDGPELHTLVKMDFKRIPVSGNENISIKFLKNRIRFLKKLERRPVFIHKNCTGCLECIKICPANAIAMHPEKMNYVVLTDAKCIRCFCCSEVCQSNAVEICRKFLGV